MWRLFSKHLYNDRGIPTDDEGRIRIDDLEMRDDVQEEVGRLWHFIGNDNIETISDISGYRREFYQLFGFNLGNVNYEKEVNIDVNISSIN